MKQGYVPAVILVLGYAAFEGYAFHRAGHRLDPLYRYDQFSAAGEAATLCHNPEAERHANFIHNERSARDRARGALREQGPQRSAGAIELQMRTRREKQEQAVRAIVADRGCHDPQIKTLLKRFENRSRRRFG
jgi:hypothetical protein